jgi:hypothetical protein
MINADTKATASGAAAGKPSKFLTQLGEAARRRVGHIGRTGMSVLPISYPVLYGEMLN